MIILKHQLYKNMIRFGAKNLNEQTENKINLPDGSYLGTGSGYRYKITDMQGNDTGYEVKSKRGIRGMKDNDPVTITNGIPTSKTWGEGGTYTKDPKVNYTPSEPGAPVENKVVNGINALPAAMIKEDPFPGKLQGGVLSGTFMGQLYSWDLNGVDGFKNQSGTGAINTGKMISEYASYLKITDAKLGIDFFGLDLSSNGNGPFYIIYTSTNGKPKFHFYDDDGLIRAN